MAEQYDHIIIGAGLSGLGLAAQLTQQRPQDSFIILEGRSAIGGTWDLFRYPGIRSDSDMYSYSFSFKPWHHSEFLGSGGRILSYLQELVSEYRLSPKIRFEHKVESAQWCSKRASWLVTVSHDQQRFTLATKVLTSCAGYYNYQQGYRPQFEGIDQFDGIIADPQHWPEALDYRDKQVVVIGSGATAASIVPEMAKRAAKVTMLQRSPSYFFSLSATDLSHKLLSKLLPKETVAKLTRRKYIGLSQLLYFVSTRLPRLSQTLLRWQNLLALRNRSVHSDNFRPAYKPWQQRLCVLPDNDLFHQIRRGKAEVITSEIGRITRRGIELTDGSQIDADIIVPATGLQLQLWGGMTLEVDGQRLNSGDMVSYKGVMYGNVPNFFNIFGYINASWTLRAELSFDHIIATLNHAEHQSAQRFYPKWSGNDKPLAPILNLNSGYVRRSRAILPQQTTEFPWGNSDFYRVDSAQMKASPIADGVIRFDSLETAPEPSPSPS